MVADHCGDCMAATMVVADMLCVSASLIELAVGFGVCKDGVEIVGE